MQLIISKRSIELIIEAEVSSEAYYNKFLQGAIWPKGESGITIGIGYDLGHNTNEQVKKDWEGKIPEGHLATLLNCAGIRGAAAQKLLTKNPELKKIKIPFDTAKEQFYEGPLPRYAKMTANTYPGLDQLKPDAIGALTSMIFNRGAALTGKNREEMAAIVPLVAKKDYAGIAAQIDKSKRIWANNPDMKGVYIRREKEAAFVKNAEREYDPAGLITVNI